MSTENNTNHTPRLRFPGFSGEWKEVKLGECCTITTGHKDVNIAVEDGQYSFYTCSHDVYKANSYSFDTEAILIAGNGDVGNLHYHKGKFEAYQRTYVLYDFKIDVQFILQNLSWNLISYLRQGIVGTSIPYIVKGRLMDYPIPIPFNPAEQQKIAECLSELDNLITAQDQKVDALKEKKKGLMQQLFPRQGETVPRLRFPGFEGEWDYVNGNELFMPISNKNHNSDLPILALTQDQGAVPREMINYNVVVSDKSVAGYKVVEVDDFIISLRSFQGGIEYSRYKGLCSPAYIVLRKKRKDMSSDFYRIYFKSFIYIQELNKNLEGIRDGKMISYQQFSEIKLPKPSPAEQQKIAECLSALDETITAESDKLEALKSHKKGLIQQLFPQPAK